MAKFEDDVQVTTAAATTTTTTEDDSNAGDKDQVMVPGEDTPITDTVAAVTVAILAVVLLLTLLVIFRALRKRRRARQGQRMDDIPTVSAGIMGASVSAYNNIPVAGRVTWEPVSPSTSSAQQTSLHQDNPSPTRAGRHNRRSRPPRGANPQSTS
ncbi:uncharacterized protein [Haliotis cracherodii]|uniref:uncharacterized protein n=1 Tax=Haliotis cracherodii TaxID=6455 RepID=UPI001EB07785|nr:uncharacterized protein LOC124116285 isoform X1 [Haliotis rufescens]XP_048236386.1 uncharacterized protein LOC124116285 isoform X2 [Haliotis rufescens]XP_048236387.1 uncharacterized protein LOC124116285 isoform X1 [Haliotis rufescens]